MTASSRFPTGAALVLACLLATLLGHSPASALGLVVPIYGGTTAQFNAVISAAAQVPLIAVINPDDGVGSSKDSFTAGKAASIRSAGGKVFGYIATNYGSVASSSVRSDMDKYISWYAVDGFFLDEMADNNLSYYTGLKSYASGKGKQILGNPGTFVPSSYINAADILMTYEDPWSAGWSSHTQVSWTNAYPPERFAAIIYSLSGTSAMQTVVNQAIADRYGWVYVTNLGLPDPFGSVPNYWTAEVDYVKSKNVRNPLVIQSQALGAGTFSLTWSANAGQWYEIQRSTDMVTWVAANAPGSSAALRVQASGAQMTASATAPVGGLCYFRIVEVSGP